MPSNVLDVAIRLHATIRDVLTAGAGDYGITSAPVYEWGTATFHVQAADGRLYRVRVDDYEQLRAEGR